MLRAPGESDMTSAPQPAEANEGGARLVPMRLLVLLLTLIGLWIARSFVLQLAWAVTMAVAFWPLYRRLAPPRPGGRRPVLAPLGLTLATGLVLMLPLAMVGVEAGGGRQFGVRL